MNKTVLIFGFCLMISACSPSFDVQSFSGVSLSKASNLRTEEQFRSHLAEIDAQCHALKQSVRGIEHRAMRSNGVNLRKGQLDALRVQEKQCRATYEQVVSLASRRGFSVDPVAEREAEQAAFGTALGRMVNESRIPTSNRSGSRPAACNQPGTSGYVVVYSQGLC